MKAMSSLLFFMLILGCSSDRVSSHLSASREARYLLSTPGELPASFWQQPDSAILDKDFLIQRRFAWNFWSEMLRFLPGTPRPSFMVWQTWYSREDLQRAFRYLYKNLGPDGRRQRLSFSANAIGEALAWNDSKQYSEPDWDQNRFKEWLARFDSPEKERAVPGMEKILFNRDVLRFLLEHYASLEDCQKLRQNQRSCTALSWPNHAVFIKTAWRRTEDGFLLDNYPSDAAALGGQWEKTQWTADRRYEPREQESFALRLPSGQKFHLTGLHAALHIDAQWFWTSLWLGQTPKDDLAADQPDTWPSLWRNYRLCAAHDWQKPLQQQSIDATWPEPLARIAHFLVQQGTLNWCSNPYLEQGENNHKTNCVGCHQHAGEGWSQQEFRRRLRQDLPSLLEPAAAKGSADFVWSLFNGPEPLVQPLMDDIEFFDVQDQF